ncbi:MAG: type II secretion system minor pseudopilin GspH [Pseudomonadales bacterium]
MKCSRGFHSGFTLIEILVVLFIVSIMSGIVVANMPSFTQTRDFDAEARRVKVLLEMARDEAVIQASEYGFRPENQGYRFYRYDELEQRWEPVDQRPFQQYSLPDNIRLTLNVEGEDFQITEDESPPVLILSSGEITPFDLTIRSGGETSMTLVSDGFAELSWQDDLQRKGSGDE